MGRSPCCSDDKALKKGPWTPEEDQMLVDYIQKHGLGNWTALPKHAGLNRCGKSCRLRWTNYLRPDIKRGKFSDEEERLIIHLHSRLGNKWSAMAARLPGRTDNEIKNYWHTHLKKKLLRAGIDPVTHRTRADLALLAKVLGTPNFGSREGPSTWDGGPLPAQADAAQLARFHLLQTVARAIIAPSNSDLVSLVASMLLRSAASVDGLFRPSRQFQGPLDSTVTSVVQRFAPEAWGFYNLAAVPNGLDVLGQPCDALGNGELLLPTTHMSSLEASTVDNWCGVDYQVPSSYSTPTAASTPSVASPSPEHVTMDHPDPEMMSTGDVSDNSLTEASEPWRDLSEVDSDSLWKYFLDDTALQSSVIMS